MGSDDDRPRGGIRGYAGIQPDLHHLDRLDAMLAPHVEKLRRCPRLMELLRDPATGEGPSDAQLALVVAALYPSVPPEWVGERLEAHLGRRDFADQQPPFVYFAHRNTWYLTPLPILLELVGYLASLLRRFWPPDAAEQRIKELREWAERVATEPLGPLGEADKPRVKWRLARLDELDAALRDHFPHLAPKSAQKERYLVIGFVDGLLRVVEEDGIPRSFKGEDRLYERVKGRFKRRRRKRGS